MKSSVFFLVTAVAVLWTCIVIIHDSNKSVKLLTKIAETGELVTLYSKEIKDLQEKSNNTYQCINDLLEGGSGKDI